MSFIKNMDIIVLGSDEMKKVEAMEKSISVSKVIIEYLEQILSDNSKVIGKMNFYKIRDNNQTMCGVNISIPSNDFSKYINLGITIDHCDVFYEQLFNDIIDNFLEHDTMGITRYYTVRGGMGQNFSGMEVNNGIGSSVRLNFIYRGNDFDRIASDYNRKIDEYLERNNVGKVRK